MKSAELDGISDYKHTHLRLFTILGNYPSRCSAAKGAELDSAAAAAKQKGPFAAVWREAGAYII